MLSMNLASDTKSLAKLIDAIIRGSRAEIPLAEQASHKLFHTCLSMTEISGGFGSSSEGNMELAVSLHNKVRNIPASTKADIVKAYVRGTVAKMILFYCNPKNAVKAIAKSIQLLAKAGVDLNASTDQPLHKHDAEICFKEAIALWRNLPENALIKILSLAEIDDLKLLIHTSCLEIVELMTIDNKEIGIYIREAYNLSQNLPLQQMLTFSQKSISISLKISSKTTNIDQFNEASNILKLVVTILENSKIVNVSSEQLDNCFRLKMIAYLSLIRIYQEVKQLDKAWSCAQLVETALSKVKDSGKPISTYEKELRDNFLFAKYTLLLKKGDYNEAEAFLWKVISGIENYTIISKALCLHVESTETSGVSNPHTIHQLYKTVLNRFPSNPEHTTTRIDHLRAMILCSSIQTSTSTNTSTSLLESYNICLELTSSLIDDHNMKKSILQEHSLRELKHLITERIKYYNASIQYKKSIDWILLLEKLMAFSNDKDFQHMILLQKSEILYQLNNLHEAYLTSEKLGQYPLSTSSILVMFKTSLAYKGFEYSVHLIRNKLNSFQNISENLMRLYMCFILSREMDNIEAMEAILTEWIDYFCAHHAWEFPVSEANSEFSATLGTIICHISDLFMRRYLKNDDNQQCPALPIRSHDRDNNTSTMVVVTDQYKPVPEVYQESVLGKRKAAADDDDKANENIVEQVLQDIVDRVAQQMSFTNDLIGLGIITTAPTLTATAPIEGNVPANKLLTCALSVLKQHILRVASVLITSADACGSKSADLTALASTEQIAWFTQMLWNFAVILTKQQQPQQLQSEQTTVKERYTIAAECLECASDISERYIKNDSANDHYIVTCLILATSLRLGVDTQLSTSDSADFRALNLKKCMVNIEKAQHFLEILNLPLENGVLITALFVQFAVYLRCDVAKAEQLIEKSHNKFLTLNPTNLLFLATICKEEHNGKDAHIVQFLTLALQNCYRESLCDYAMIGEIYIELIRRSASRKEAFERITDFEQLLLSLRNNSTATIGSGIGSGVNIPMPSDVIDQVCITAYNYGLTLYELGQRDLSEKFMSKAVHLFQYCSSKMLVWKENIDEAYSRILKARQDNRLLDGATVAFEFSDLTTIGGGGQSSVTTNIAEVTSNSLLALLG